MDTVRSILYPPPPSLLVNTLSVATVVSLATEGILEVKGTHIAYSKFLEKSPRNRPAMLPGRVAMLLTYIPALIAAVASFYAPVIEAVPRGVLLRAALSVHFFKRVLEVHILLCQFG